MVVEEEEEEEYPVVLWVMPMLIALLITIMA